MCPSRYKTRPGLDYHLCNVHQIGKEDGTAMGLPVPSTEVPSLHPRPEVHPEHVAAASSAAGDSQEPAATGTKQKVKNPVCVLYLSLSNHLSIHDLLFLTCGFFLRLLSVE